MEIRRWLKVSSFFLVKVGCQGSLGPLAPADSKDTSFTYMLHPVTNTPIFAHVDMLEPGRHDKEELRCFYAAQYEMVKLRPIFGVGV